MSGYVYLKGDAETAYVALQSADGRVEYCRKEISWTWHGKLENVSISG